jgi:hypothetical protein
MSSSNPKKFLLLLAMILSVVIEGCREPPITIAQRDVEAVFSVGRTFRLFWDSTGSPVNIGGTGGPNTYDFSNLQFVLYDSVTMLPVTDIPQLAARFPSNAFTFNEEGNTLFPVFSFSNHAFNRLGRARLASDTTEWYQHITPADKWVIFPVTFNTQSSQSGRVIVDTTYVNGIATQTSADTSSGTNYIDGYGTLLLPGGLAFQCLRMRTVTSPPRTSKEFQFWTREGAVILIDSDTSQPDTGVVKRGYIIYFSPQTPNQSTRD